MRKPNIEFDKLAHLYRERMDSGLTHIEIKEELVPICNELGFNIESIRQKAQQIKKLDYINSNREFHNIAKARNKLLTDRKVITKQKNLLHNDANVVGFRNLIIETLENTNWNYQPCKIIPQKTNENCGKIAYIISDEHYRGKCDNQHLIDIYKIIKQDIQKNKYKNVELWYGADQIDGLIHLSSIGTNEGAIIPSINYSKIVVSEINSIPEVSRVIFVNKANHSEMRVLGTKRGELAKEDLGLVMEELFRNGLRQDIEFVSNEVINFKFNNKNIAILHGSQSYCKTREKLMNYWSAKFGIIPDLFVLAHFHTFKVNEYGFNRYLAVMPSAKNWNGDYEKQNGYISTNQIIKLQWKEDTPQWTIINLK